MAVVVMGVVNVTPDSFSDGGRWADTDAAVAHARQLVAEGADIVDVGGESTRPGATRPLVSEELDRVVPVIEALAADGTRVSVDTMRAEVAAAAVAAGAAWVNDVSGGLADPAMLATVAATDATYVAMHWRAHSDRMQDFTSYPRGVLDVVDELRDRIEAARTAGIGAERLVVDPGIGFAKTAATNWEVLARLDELAVLGHRVLVGVSRKSFLGALLADPDGTPRPPLGRDLASHAVTLALLDRPCLWGVRVHDVLGTRDVLSAWERVKR
ncbi:dihydropteroate synthase [Nocardioides sp.]|uniref:dihydropteroate synthase n=1 Tax=Nocardioides sp. TaxID=35761 RepID=UPI002727058B|nr:dihydropteroate synthase [Nocardioides sp.]MDO9457464.1 dihydropteroate synthase [Nocardioides sp.]